MKISRRKLFESQNPLQLTTSTSELGLSNALNCDKISAIFHISRSGTTASVDGELTAKAYLECDRCLESFDREIRGELKILVTENPSINAGTSDSEIIVFPQGSDELDISSLLSDAIVLELPMKKVCNGTCKGLCPGCGVNLNHSDCECQNEGFDERWAPLKEIKLDQLEN